MATPTFYHADLTTACKSIELTASEAQHARTVRRLSEGQHLLILNGFGLVAQGKISVLERHKVIVNLQDTTLFERKGGLITVYTAVPKGDRQRVLVESLTQLGVQRIVPIRCEFSATPLNSKALVKWRRYGIEAIKQSQNPWLPNIAEEVPLSSVFDSIEKDFRWFADASGDYFTRLLKTAQLKEVTGADAVHSIFIGPEGGFSATEIKFLSDSGCRAVKLADTILRTEMAAMAAVAQLSPLLRSS